MRVPFLLALLLVGSPGCNEDSPSGPSATTTTTTAPPLPKAEVTMEIEGLEAMLSPVRKKLLRFTWDIALKESGGVDARVNFIRQELWNRDFDQYERSEIGFDDVPEACGTNLLSANSEWRCRISFDFNLSNFEGFLRLTVTLVDAFGHPIVLVLNAPLSDPLP